ncbi:MAG: TetR/AcrR family transcriptional regulator C-terminal domain-containing protein [Pseudomonadota bacterium]
MKKTDKALPKDPTTTPRRAGRRPRGDGTGTGDLSRIAVVQCAVALARKEPIAELSMVRVARELGVAPGLIHYYMGSRDDLVSAVINTMFRERMEALPATTNNWRTDLDGVARSAIKTLEQWPGLATYIGTHNRSRLFQRVTAGEVDYGLAFFDHVATILRDGGFTKQQAALAYHLLLLFVMSMAAERENRQAPGEHEAYIVNYVAGYERESIPGAAFIVEPFARLDSHTTFEAGLRLLMDGFEAWLVPPTRKRRGAA